MNYQDEIPDSITKTVLPRMVVRDPIDAQYIMHALYKMAENHYDKSVNGYKDAKPYMELCLEIAEQFNNTLSLHKSIEYYKEYSQYIKENG